jgi:hypothetical protein
MTATTTAPHSFHLTEKGHARMAADLPKVTAILRQYATMILTTYGGQPQAPQLQQDLAKFALWTVEHAEQLLATMAAVSRAEYPGAAWLSTYGQDPIAKQNKEEEQQKKGTRKEIALVRLITSPYWIEETYTGDVVIQHLACPACGDENAWTLTDYPLFIKCTDKDCGANIRVFDLFPELRAKVKAAQSSEGTGA